MLSSNKYRLILVGLVLAISLGYLLYTALPGSLHYNLTVSELLDDEDSLDDRTIRVAGKLDQNTHVRAEGTLDHTFALVEGGQRLNAEYSGVIPDLFDNEHSEIFLEGNYDGGVFHVSTVIVRCPSKYRAQAE